MTRKYLEGKLMYTGMVREESITSNTTLLVTKFTDRHGTIYSWVPKWSDLLLMVEEAKSIEKLNVGKHGKGSFILDSK